MSAIAAAASVETPAIIHLTDPQHLPVRSPTSFSICDLLARVLSDLVPALEWESGEAASAVDRRGLDGQAGGEL